jgi:hypothetical protein
VPRGNLFLFLLLQKEENNEVKTPALSFFFSFFLLQKEENNIVI